MMVCVIRNVRLPVEPQDDWLSSCAHCRRHHSPDKEDPPTKWDVVLCGKVIANVTKHDSSRSPRSLVDDLAAGGGRPIGAGATSDRVNPVEDSAGDTGSDLEVVDGHGRWLVPGWIDVQVNDLEWMSRWDTQQCSKEQHAERIRTALRHQAKLGVTGLCLATVASPLEPLLAYLDAMNDVMESQKHQITSTNSLPNEHDYATYLHGAVVEGTFMNPQCHGCHNPIYVLPPSRTVLDQLLDTHAVKTINIAPEMGSSEVEILELIRHAVSRGVLVAAGHCKPHAEMTRRAVDAGCSYIIHLGNGPTGSSTKTAFDGGMMEESLRNDDLVATVICDNHHVHPAMVRDWTVRKTLQRMVAVSDAAFVLGVPGDGEFEVLGRKGKPSEDGTCLRPLRDDPLPGGRGPCSTDDVSGLFGSCANMQNIFENLVNLFSEHTVGILHREHPALSLHCAVSVATALCSTNPAALLAKQRRQCRAPVAPGQAANVLLLDIADRSSHHASPSDRHCADGESVQCKAMPRLRVAVDRIWCVSSDGIAM